MKVQIIRTSGAEEEHEIARVGAVEAIHRLIGCDCFDAVNLRDGRVMLVDDDGIAAGKTINEKATAHYHRICKPGTTHPIVGDVAIARDEDFA